MKKRQLLQKAGAWILSAALTVSCLSGIPAANANAADAPANWKKEIYIDFGTGTGIEGNVDTDLVDFYLFQSDSYTYDCNEPLVAGYGTWLYNDPSKDVGTIYGGTSNGQKIGFDKFVPAGVTNDGKAYFRDWVFSPDGEPYTFSVDLPVGQYRVYVYTGNKAGGTNNVSLISFSDNDYGCTYDQTSNTGTQYAAADTVYVVTVKEGTANSGCGTLSLKVFDDTIQKNEDGTYDESYTESNTVFYGTDSNVRDFVDNGNPSAVTGKIVTARLNGIEIQPLEEPVYADSVVSTGNNTDIKVGVNQSVALDAVAKNADGDEVTERMVYSSSDPTVATVDPKTGDVTGITLGGTATITATTPSLWGNEEKSLKYNVSVIKSVTSVNFVDTEGTKTTSYTMLAGDKLTVKATASPEDATDRTVKYSFATPTDIATINAETGEITAEKAGTVKVRATSVTNSNRIANATLTILPKFSIEYRTAEISLAVGQEQKNTLTMVVDGSDDDKELLDKNISYSYESSDPTVATVSEDGTVKALKNGPTTITTTVTAGGTQKTASYKVTVKPAEQHATALNVKETNIKVAIKKTAQITASLTPADSVDTITYTPKDAKIATVDKNGKVIGVKPGKTQITVSANGLTKVVNVTVTSPATSIKIKGKAKRTLKKGKKITLKATVKPSNSTDKVTWKSSKTKVATVSKKGVVKAKKKGKTVITAIAGKKKAKVTITVK